MCIRDRFYVTRLQKERLQNKNADPGEYVRFDARALKGSRTHEAVVMHPLPRTTELAYELDADPRACLLYTSDVYKRQEIPR